jgi:hypothetical protein
MDNELKRAELEFDKLAKLAEKICVPIDDYQFAPHTQKELVEAADAASIIERIEKNHCKLDITDSVNIGDVN